MGTEVPGVQLHESQATEEALAPKTVVRFKERVRELTRRTRGISLARMVHDRAEYLRGWIGYFGRCETPEVLDKLEPWLRRPTSVDGLETVETRIHKISRAGLPRQGCTPRPPGRIRSPFPLPETEETSVRKSALLAALKAEIQRHDVSSSVDEPPTVA
jgi:hypothetical protein